MIPAADDGRRILGLVHESAHCGFSRECESTGSPDNESPKRRRVEVYVGQFRTREGNSMMIGKRESATVVMHRGVLAQGQLSVEYYTSQPAPTQWIAVGLVPARINLGTGHQPAQMLVGSGQSEEIAVSELSRRLARLEAVAPHCPTEYSREQTVPTVQEPRLLARSSRPGVTSHSYGATSTLVGSSSGRDW